MHLFVDGVYTRLDDISDVQREQGERLARLEATPSSACGGPGTEPAERWEGVRRSNQQARGEAGCSRVAAALRRPVEKPKKEAAVAALTELILANMRRLEKVRPAGRKNVTSRK
jgi:hypothetical protein